jgi:hypothetical protein
MRKSLSILALAGTLAGCQSVGGPGVSTYLECNRGTRLKVDYVRNHALVSIAGRRPIALKQVPAVGGSMYERQVYRLHMTGNGAQWTDSRMPSQSCSRVAVPR